MMPVRERWLKTGAGIGACLWTSSLVFPALSFQFDQHRQLLFGYKVLAAGWIHLLAFQFSWLANLALPLLAYDAWHPRLSPALRNGFILLLLLALASLIQLFLRQHFFQFPRPHAGFWMWLTGNGVIALVAIARATEQRRSKRASVANIG